MANPPKPWKAEYAKSARSSCRTCKSNISKEALRLCKMVQSSQFDGFVPMWNHASCVLRKVNQIKFLDDVEGIESLRWEDQQKIRKYVEGGGSSTKSDAMAKGYSIEVSQTSRATCRHCSKKTMKGEVRISVKPDGQGAKGLAWHHVNRFLELCPSTQVEKLSGWTDLTVPAQGALRALINVPFTAMKDTEAVVQENKEMPDLLSTSKAATKHKTVSGRVESSNKSEGDLSTSRAASVVTLNNLPDERASDFESIYRCHGCQSAWSKCTYSTCEPERLKGKWKVPEETNIQYLEKWFKSQKTKKPIRVLPPATSSSPASQAAKGSYQSSTRGSLGDLRVSFSRLPKESKEEWKRKIEEVGGLVHAKIKKATNCLVQGGVLDDPDVEMRKARRMKIPVVREDYLVDCFKRQKKLPFSLYKVEL